jgi:hypothetical protein
MRKKGERRIMRRRGRDIDLSKHKRRREATEGVI